MGKSSTNTTSTSSQPNPIVQGAATDIASRASNAINTLTPQQLVPNATPNMEQAWALTNGVTGGGNLADVVSTPFYNRASGLYDSATQPLYDTVGRYMSPYIQSVVDATQRQFNNQNAIADEGIVGNAAAQGAWGGDRAEVARGILAGQQQTAQAPIIAGLYNQGYNTALGAAEAQNWQQLQAAQGLQGLGAGFLQTPLAAAQALYGAGQQQYGLQQAQNTIPLQIPQYEAGLLGTVAGTLGGTSSTTSPAASPFSQAAGLGIGAVGLAGATGGFGADGYLTNLFGGGAGNTGGTGGLYRHGGRIGHYAPGGIVSMGINAPNHFAFNSADPFDFATAPVPHASAGSSNPLAPIVTQTQTQSGGGGGIGDIIGAAAKIAPLFFLKRGGIVGYAGGGGVNDDDAGFQHPRGGFMPSVFLIPRGVGGGMGIPRPPTGIAVGQNPPGSIDTTPGGIMGMLKSTGAIGDKGWLTHGPGDYADGGVVDRRRAGVFDMPPGGTGAWTTDGGVLDARLGPDYADMTRGIVGRPDTRRDLPRYAEGGDLDPDILTESGMPPDMVARIMAAPSPGREVTVGEGNGAPYAPPRSAGIAPREYVPNEPGKVYAPWAGMGVEVAASPASRQGTVDFWKSKGAPSHVAEGIADRVGAESGFLPVNPGDNGTSDGLYQHHADRLAKLQVQPNWQDPMTQHNFSYSEVTGGDPIATAHWNEIQAAPNRAEAGRLWDKYFERSAGGPGSGGRSISGSGGGQPRGIAGISAADAGGGGDAPSAGVGVIPRASTLTPSQIDDIKSGDLRGSGVSPWMALAAAGFGMAAGRSPSAMQNIGAGALEGLKFLQEQRKEQPELRLKTAQATQAEVATSANQAMRDYYAGKTKNPAGAVDHFENTLAGVQKGIAGGGNTIAIPTPGGGAVTPGPSNPAPVTAGAAGAPPSTSSSAAVPQVGAGELSAGEQVTERRVLGQIDAGRAQIKNLQDLLPFQPDTASAARIETAIAGLIQHNAGLEKELPSYIRSTKYGGSMAGVPAAVEEARQKAAIALQNAGPMKAAEVGETLMKYRGADGRQYEAPTKLVAAGTAPGMRPASQAPIDPRTGQPLPGSGVSGPVTEFEPGEASERTGQGETANKERVAINTDADAARTQAPILTGMKENAQKFYTGPLNEWVGEWNRAGAAINPAKYAETAAAREQFLKERGTFVRQATHDVSPRAGIQEVEFIQRSLFGPETSLLGIKNVIAEFEGLNDYKVAKAQALRQYMASNGGLARGFEDSWSASAPVNPYTYVVARLEPASRKALYANMGRTQEGRDYIANLSREMQYAHQNGLTGLQR